MNQILLVKTSPLTLKKDINRILTSKIFNLDSKKMIYLKLNGNYDEFYPGSNTSPWLLDCLLKGLKQKGFTKIIAIEGNGYLFSAERMIENTGLIKILNKHKIKFMSYEKKARDKNELPQILHGAQLINLPVAHTHGQAIVSCAVKNLFGLLPQYRWKYHQILEKKLWELYKKVECFSIVDGTVGMIGESTRRGDPIRMDFLMAGNDMIQLDFLVSRIMGFHKSEIPLLTYANQQGVDFKSEVIGDYELDSLPQFDCHYKHSKLKKMSLKLQSNKITKRIIEKRPILDIFHGFRGFYEKWYLIKKKPDWQKQDWQEYFKPYRAF